MTYLDHDHRERKNIRFFAKCPTFVQDLRRSPSRCKALIVRAAPYKIQVLSDRSKPKIGDPCVASGIDKHISLDACKKKIKRGLEKITYSLEIAVGYIAGVEKVKSFGDIG